MYDLIIIGAGPDDIVLAAEIRRNGFMIPSLWKAYILRALYPEASFT